MPEKPPPENEIDDWKAAERALAEARRLQGSQRFEALKRAGQLRYDAHKKHHEKEPTSRRKNSYLEKNSEVSREHGNTLVRNFREIYGPSFAAGHADTATLREVISRLDETSLRGLHRDHETGQLKKISSGKAIWGKP
jgi:hypothetical protein